MFNTTNKTMIQYNADVDWNPLDQLSLSDSYNSFLKKKIQHRKETSLRKASFCIIQQFG